MKCYMVPEGKSQYLLYYNDLYRYKTTKRDMVLHQRAMGSLRGSVPTPECGEQALSTNLNPA